MTAATRLAALLATNAAADYPDPDRSPAVCQQVLGSPPSFTAKTRAAACGASTAAHCTFLLARGQYSRRLAAQ